MTNSIYSQSRKFNYFENDKTNIMNSSMGVASSYKRPAGQLIGNGRPGILPLSTIERKIKDMLATSFTDKSLISSKKTKQSPSETAERLKPSPSAHRNQIGTKHEIVSKYVMKNRGKSGDIQKVMDLSNKDHFNVSGISGSRGTEKLVDRYAGAREIIDRTLGRNNINESIVRKYNDSAESSREALKANSLYQKFSKKISNSRIGNVSDIHDKQENQKRAKSKPSSAMEREGKSQEIDKSLYLRKKTETQAPTRSIELTLHKRAESENLKRLKKPESTDYKSSIDKNPSAIRRPISQSGKLTQTNYSHSSKTPVSSHQTKPYSKDSMVAKVKSPVGGSTIGKKSGTVVESIRKAEGGLPVFEGSKVIIKDFGCITAFSVNTHQGTVRSYNEDRVSILLNAQQR